MKNREEFASKLQEYLKTSYKYLEYKDIEDIAKYIIQNNIGDEDIEYYIDNDFEDGDIIEFQNININGIDDIKEIRINAKLIEKELTEINESFTSISRKDSDELKNVKRETAQSKKMNLIYNTLYSSYISCSQYVKNENFHNKSKLEAIDENIYFNETYDDEILYDQIKDAIYKTDFDISTLELENRSEVMDNLKKFRCDKINEASKSEIEKYYQLMQPFYKEAEDKEVTFLKLMSEYKQYFNNAIKEIDNTIDNGRQYDKFESLESNVNTFMKKIRQRKEVEFKSIQSDIQNIEKDNEYVEDYSKYSEELRMVQNVIEDKEYEDNIKLSPNVSKIIDTQRKIIEEREKINPSWIAKKHITRKYREVSQIIDEDDIYKFCNEIDKVPEDLENKVKQIFGPEYNGFVAEIKEVKNKGKEEKVNKEKEYNSYVNSIYKNEYKDLTLEEKKELFKYSDSDIDEHIINELKNDIQISKEGIKNSVAYNRIMNYDAKREDKNEEVKNLLVKEFEGVDDLKNFIGKYKNSENIINDLNNVSKDEINNLNGIANHYKIDIKDTIDNVNFIISHKYNSDLESCGNYLMDIINFESDENFVSLLSNENYDKEIKEEVVGAAKYQLDRSNDDRKNMIRDSFNNLIKSGDYEVQKITSLNDMMAFSDMIGTVELRNLKEKAALVNLKVNDIEDLDLAKLGDKISGISEAKKICSREKINKATLSEQEQGLRKSYNTISEKISYAKERLAESINLRKDNKEAYGGNIR